MGGISEHAGNLHRISSIQTKKDCSGSSFSAFIQHFFDHFKSLDLELEMLDHPFFHHDFGIKHALHQDLFLVIVQRVPHLHHEHLLLLHAGGHSLFVHNLFIS